LLPRLLSGPVSEADLLPRHQPSPSESHSLSSPPRTVQGKHITHNFFFMPLRLTRRIANVTLSARTLSEQIAASIRFPALAVYRRTVFSD